MSITTIKNQVKAKLDTLVTDGVIANAVQSDIKLDPLNMDVGNFPVGVVMPPAVESEVLDNVTITRTYIYDLIFVFNAEDLDTTNELETKMEAILNAFDNDPTLGGAANAGVLPIASAPEPFQHNGNDRILFVVNLRAAETVLLTFS